MKKKLLLLFMTLLTILALSACGNGGQADEPEASNEVLVMGTSADYPPFEYIETGESQEIIGFDIDLAKAIGEELGYEVVVKDMDFNGLIPAINTGKVDFVMAGMTPTPERKENVDFSEIYYTANHMIVSTKGSNIQSLENLKGKKVGVQLGSIQEGKAEEIAKEVEITIESRNRIPELIQELKIGRFDVVIIEDIVAKGFIEKDTELTGFTLPDVDEAGSAVAFPKGSELTSEFNNVIKEMKANGELETLVQKWFSE